MNGFNPYRQPGPVYTVVGVAANVKNGGLSGEDDPEFYELRTNVHPEYWDNHHFFLLESSLPASVVGTVDSVASCATGSDGAGGDRYDEPGSEQAGGPAAV
jgi:hypothetical protein